MPIESDLQGKTETCFVEFITKFIHHPIFRDWFWISMDNPFLTESTQKTVKHAPLSDPVHDEFMNIHDMYRPKYFQAKVFLGNHNVAFSATVAKQRYNSYLDVCTYIACGVLTALLPPDGFKGLASNPRKFLASYGVDKLCSIITSPSDPSTFLSNSISNNIHPDMRMWDTEMNHIFNFIYTASSREITIFHNNKNLGVYHTGKNNDDFYLTVISDTPKVTATLNYCCTSATSLFQICLSQIIKNISNIDHISKLIFPNKLKNIIITEHKNISLAKLSLVRNICYTP